MTSPRAPTFSCVASPSKRHALRHMFVEMTTGLLALRSSNAVSCGLPAEAALAAGLDPPLHMQLSSGKPAG